MSVIELWSSLSVEPESQASELDPGLQSPLCPRGSFSVDEQPPKRSEQGLLGGSLTSVNEALVPLLPPCYLQPTGKMLSDDQLVQPLVYLERLELIRNVCRDEALKSLSHTAVSKFVLDRIFVCDKHKILFCQTPKVGNTQWKKVLIVLNGVCCAGVCPLLGAGGVCPGRVTGAV